MKFKIFSFLFFFLFTLFLYADFDELSFTSNLTIDSTYQPVINFRVNLVLKELIFEKDSSGYIAKTSLQFTFLKEKDLPIHTITFDTTFNFTTIPQDLETMNVSFNLTGLKIPAETKKIFFDIYDRLNGRSKKFTVDIRIPPIPKNGNFLSSLKLINDRDNFFFSTDTVKFETIMTLKNEKRGHFNIILIDPKNRVVYKQKTNLQKQTDTLFFVKDLYGGKYLLRVEYIEDNKIINFLTTEVLIKFSFLKSEIEYQDMINALSYIAKWDEIDKLKNVSKENREAKWNDFWLKQLLNPSITMGIGYDEFLERYNYANKNFSGFKKGYKTDFGRIYIMYGQPDEIERHPFDKDSKPYEIWYYYSKNITFIFIDINGYGEYVLQNYLEQMR